jgi:hypothetical protein
MEGGSVAKLLNRRKLLKVASGATLGGAAFFDNLLAEAEQKGGLSRDSVKLLLSANGLDDLQLTEGELDKVKDSFERTLESIRKIRAYELKQSIEPATVFLVRR